MTKKIAIISPNQNAYSETFIQAHKNLLKGDIDFLFGGTIPTHSEKNGSLYIYYQKYNLKLKFKKLLPVFIFNKLYQNKLNDRIYFEYYLKKNNIEIVLAEYGPTGAECLPILKNLAIPLIIHFHGADATVKDVIDKYFRKYIEMFNYARNIIVVSNLMKEKLIQLGCPENKIILNTYGPNDLFFLIKPSFSKKQFIAVGRFVDKKAPYYTILAFSKVFERYPDCKLIMAGDGPLLNTAMNITKFLNLTSSVEFPGVISPKEYMNYLRDSIAFVQHSITANNGDMEGTPVAILEASAAGLPVIATRHAGIIDVVIEEETGFLVEEHDVNMMAKKMILLIEDINLSVKLGQQGKKRIERFFSINSHIKKIQLLFDNCK